MGLEAGWGQTAKIEETLGAPNAIRSVLGTKPTIAEGAVTSATDPKRTCAVTPADRFSDHSLNQTLEGAKAAPLLERRLGRAEAVGKPDRHLAAFALNITSVVWVTDRAEGTS